MWQCQGPSLPPPGGRAVTAPSQGEGKPPRGQSRARWCPWLPWALQRLDYPTNSSCFASVRENWASPFAAERVLMNHLLQRVHRRQGQTCPCLEAIVGGREHRPEAGLRHRRRKEADYGGEKEALAESDPSRDRRACVRRWRAPCPLGHIITSR